MNLLWHFTTLNLRKVGGPFPRLDPVDEISLDLLREGVATIRGSWGGAADTLYLIFSIIFVEVCLDQKMRKANLETASSRRAKAGDFAVSGLSNHR